MNILLIALTILIVPAVLAVIFLKIIPFKKTAADTNTDGYTRKFENADLRKSRFLFLSLGLVASFGTSSYVLNYEFEDDSDTAVLKKKVEVEDVIYEDVVNTEQLNTPPPETKVPVVTEELIPEKIKKVEKKEPEEKKEEEKEIEFNYDDLTLTDNNSSSEVIEDNKIYFAVDVSAEFPGGIEALQKFINEETNKRLTSHDKEKMRNLPPRSKVIVSYVIEKDGSISNLEVLKGIHYESINNVIVESFEDLPKWKAGESNGYKKRLRYTQTIHLK